MQHPVGYTLNNGRAEMTDFGALLANPQVWYEFLHVITAAIAMGGNSDCRNVSFPIVEKDKKVDRDFSKNQCGSVFAVALFGSITVLIAGDEQMKYLVEEQPMKFAAMEGTYEDTGDPAAWTVVAWANEREHKRVFGVEIPYMLSILAFNEPSGSIDGMNTVNQDLIERYGDRNYFPPVNTLFWSFRIMAGFGCIDVVGFFIGVILYA